MTAVAVLVAGSAGALARWWVWRAVDERGSIPWATFAVNVAGSLGLGLVAGLALRGDLGSTTATVLGTGFFGAFTTYSTFAVDSLALTETRGSTAALAYVFASLAAGVALAWSALTALG